MHEVHAFGTVVLLVAAGFSLAVGTSRLSERLAVPGPALFLVAAAVVSDIFPKISDRLTIREVERVGVVALVVILFDGGSRIGTRRLRAAALPVVSLGVLGTFATAGVTTLAARWLLGFSWTARRRSCTAPASSPSSSQGSSPATSARRTRTRSNASSRRSRPSRRSSSLSRSG